MNLDILIQDKLSPEDREKIESNRQSIHEKMNQTPQEGVAVDFLGKKFKVMSGVFYPHESSEVLIGNMQISPGDNVLDVGTGCGVIAIFAALRGAQKVIAIDISPEAVKNTKKNVDDYYVGEVVEGRVSDMFKSIKRGEKFDVITANLPFTDTPSNDLVELSTYDNNFHANRELFEKAKDFLNPGGKIYLAQGNFGSLEEVFGLANQNGFSHKLIGRKEIENDPRIFYTFEFREK